MRKYFIVGASPIISGGFSEEGQKKKKHVIQKEKPAPIMKTAPFGCISHSLEPSPIFQSPKSREWKETNPGEGHGGCGGCFCQMCVSRVSLVRGKSESIIKSRANFMFGLILQISHEMRFEMCIYFAKMTLCKLTGTAVLSPQTILFIYESFVLLETLH